MKNRLIGEMAARKVIERYISRFHPDRELLKDLAQEVYVELLEYPGETIVEAAENGSLVYLGFRIAKNMMFSKTSQFYYKYLRYEKDKTRDRFYCEELPDDTEGV